MTKEHEQLSFDASVDKTDDKPVVCLGMEFKNDDERREYFRNELRQKLPEVKNIEGFPIGEDEDIIALSDPPYYTACPNPWLRQLITAWENKKEGNKKYSKLPFASDVSMGKNDAFYNAHAYHTKVPYKAIMKYILHYTSPGDIIFDGYSGTGATGVAARESGNVEAIKSLGYQVDNDNAISNDGYQLKVGERKVILNDLSPSASLISYNYNARIDINEYKKEANSILKDVEEELGWMYSTEHITDKGESITGQINDIVWSDVFLCPNCSHEIIYWDVSVDFENRKMNSDFSCPSCQINLKKKDLERYWVSYYDKDLKKTLSVLKQVPVQINYSIGNKRYSKKPETYDYHLIDKIEEHSSHYYYPTDRMPKGYNTKQPLISHGLQYVHQFYTKRNLIILASLYDKIIKSRYSSHLLFFFQASINRSTKTNRFRFGGTGGLSGTLYIPSLLVERNSNILLKNKLRDHLKILEEQFDEEVHYAITTQSSTESFNIEENTIDYIFTDPPFGSNIMYSELNFLWESWYKIYTNNKKESIINPVQNKGIEEYKYLMEKAFKQYYKILKPKRWITVEFSNSQSNIWNAIQESIQKAGFIIANVAALDKKQGSFKAVTTTIAVKQDLVISAYKPEDKIVKLINDYRNTSKTSWTFVEQHLNQLPVFSGEKGLAEIISERTPRILFDRMVAYHVQNSLPVPISSAEFQEEIAQRFPMRDGMVFLESQVAEYDKKRILVKDFSQQSLFVSDENSAIEWLRQQLMNKPQTRQDIHPNFMKEIQHIAKHEILPELDDLLNENFLQYEGGGDVPSQITTYLRRNFKDLRGLEADDPAVISKAMNRWYVPDPSKQGDLERLRERALLREFDGYLAELEGNKKKLRQFRTEAIRAGFKKAYSEKEFEKIVEVGARLPEKIIQEDDKLLMFYDNASMLIDM